MKRLALLALLSGLISFPVIAGELEIMTYNVENLFDTSHDEGMNDWEFLPLGFPLKEENCRKMSSAYRKRCLTTDWTASKLPIKLGQIRRVLLEERGVLPDILALSEVENENVLTMLAENLGYGQNYVISSGPDVRGINVALLYKASSDLTLMRVKEHPVEGKGLTRPTRNILEVEFKVYDRYRLLIFVNHWPSQGARSPARVSAARVLKQVIYRRLKTIPSRHVVALGDFNTIPKDNPHPFDTVLLNPDYRNPLFDLHSSFMNDPDIDPDIKRELPPGSYYYARGKTWNLLDRMFINGNLRDGQGLDVNLEEYSIYNPSFAVHQSFVKDLSDAYVKGAPWRYNFNADHPDQAGFSDHFPVRVTISDFH